MNASNVCVSRQLFAVCLAAVLDGILSVFRPRWHVSRGVPSGLIQDSALVLDVSPSMETTDWQPSRLAAAKEAAEAYCRRTASQNSRARIAIVSYGKRAELLCRLTPAVNLRRLCSRIQAARTIDCTNVHAGLATAGSAMRRCRRPCRIVLLSDGHHNYGRDPRPLAETLKHRAIIECIGIGGQPHDVDEALMRDIASPDGRGGKRYRWIGDRQQLVERFEELAGGITRE